MLAKAWHSPTLTTWASFFSRSLGIVLVLPLVLTRLPASDFNLWALFAIMLGLQLLVDMGFCVTFVRAIAIALAGASGPDAFLKDAPTTGSLPPNWELVNRIIATMRYIYRRLALIYLGLMATVGTALLSRPIALSENPHASWVAWIIVVITGNICLRTSYLTMLLQGLNEIALVRRWEAVTSLASVVSAFVVLYSGGGILALMLATQFWSLVGVWRNRWLSRAVAEGRFCNLPASSHDSEMLARLWPATWRSGVGVLMSYGLIQATGLIQAQIATTTATASYLLCLRMLQLVSSFSQAPFYSKLAWLPRLRAEGRTEELLDTAARGMSRSLWAYALGFGAVSLFGSNLLRWLGSEVSFPDAATWVMLGSMFFAERYAAMHLHLYSTTNDIITHIANGVTGVLCIVFALVFVPALGLLAMPAGLLAGYLAFYSWYPVRHSYLKFKMSFCRFELRTTLGPLLCFAAAAFLHLIRS